MKYPYTFVKGTKAVAEEANENFKTVGDAVDTNTTNITDLQNNKADLSLSNLNETGLDAFANKDAGNFTTTGKTYLSGLGMPSSRKITLSLTSGEKYTAPANGYLSIVISAKAAGNYINLWNNSAAIGMVSCAGSANELIGAYLPLQKGDVANVNFSTTDLQNSHFSYLEGAK